MEKIRIGTVVVVLLSLCLITGCVNQHPDEKIANVENPRIVATSPAVVEIMARLDLDLAGVPDSELTETLWRYKDAVKTGTAMSPDLEILKSLNPDYVLSPSSLLNDLQSKYEVAGLNYRFLNLKSVPGMYKSIQELGDLLGREVQAKSLIEEFKTFYNKYQAGHDGAIRPYVLILMGLPGSYVVATENSYVGSLVEMAGGINVYAGTKEEFLNVNTEDMHMKDPDIILRTAHALPDQVMEMFAKEFGENDIRKHFRAVQTDKVYDLTAGNFGMSANFKYPQALMELERLLYEN